MPGQGPNILKGMGEKESGRRISLTLREIYASPSLERPLATMIKHPGNILIVGDSLIGRENNEGIDPGLIQFGQKGRLLEPGFIRKRCTKVALPGAHILKVFKFLENYDAPESVSDLVLLVGGNDVENSSTLSPVNTRMRGIRPEKRRSLLLSAENAP